VTGARAGAMLNSEVYSELWIVDCELPLYFSPPLTAYCRVPAALEEPQVRRAEPALRLLSAYCLLPTAFEGGGMERALLTWQSWTRSHRRQVKKKLVTLKSEGT
jgi:hypothetical protein